jgi:tripartite-type tricarboxylate transporter receptor subunit TctC
VQPFAAGGALDPIARLLGNILTEKFGQQVVMEYRTGAGGAIGTSYVAKQRPDGYTLLINPAGPMTVAKHLSKEVDYETLRDFVPIIKIAETPFIIFTSTKSLPMKTLPELVAYAKANPEAVAAANTGSGTLAHLAAMLLEQSAGIKLRHVPYRGTGQLITDMLSGQVDMTISFYAGFGPHVDNGSLRMLGISSDENVPDVLKSVPTTRQAGIPDMQLAGWYGLYAPRGTPPDVIAKIYGALSDYLKTGDARKKLAELGLAPAWENTEQLSKYIADEDTRLGALIRAVGLTPQ